MMFVLADVDANVLAAIAAAGGAILAKIIEKWTIRRSETLNDAARIRDELRVDITRLREENQQLETEVLMWHEKYWNEKSAHESSDLLIKAIRSTISDLTQRIKELENDVKLNKIELVDVETELKEFRQLLSRLLR